MKKTYLYILTLLTAAALDLAAGIFQTATAQPSRTLQEQLETLAADPVLSQAAFGICVRTGDGRTLAEVNAAKMLVPASNMKLISTGTALYTLGPDYRFRTWIGHDGEIIDGVLYGNLYITGGGDPTLGSKDSIAVALDRTFGEWEKIVREAGITHIKGHVVGDGSRFEGMTEEPTWQWNDIGTYYGAGATGLMFYENMQSFSVSAGAEVGADVNISPSYPLTPWMEFRYDCTTGRKGTGDRLYMYTSDLAPVAEIRGTFAVDRATKRLDCANKFPEYTCAWYFADWLRRHGIKCDRGAADDRLNTEWLAETDGTTDIDMLGYTTSPSLERIVFETNHASNNLYAETLLRTLGKELHGSACYDSAYVAMEDAFKALGVDMSHELHLQDGSGLSRQNYVSPDFLCRFLRAMMSADCYGSYLRSLPSPGGNGTLLYNMKSQSETLKNRIKAKSGSMNGVRCYSGYILPAGHKPADCLTEDMKARTVVFSIMVNNCTAPTWTLRPLLDRMMATIADYGN